jgi:hypothetical protein
MQTVKLVILGALISLCFGQESELREKPLSVCEVLERRAELMGRFETQAGDSKTVPGRGLVSVRGEVKSGPHGSYLAAAPTCTFKLRITGTTWPSGFTTPGAAYPNIIWLDYPVNTSRFESSHAPFEVDWVSVRRAEGQARRQGCCSVSDQLFETFTGLLVSYDKFEMQASPAAPIVKRRGFGPAGLDAPAELLIKSVADVVVIRKPTK